MPRINTVNTTHYRGLGDTVMLAWIAEAARNAPDPFSFYATRDGHYDLLELLGQQVSDDPQPTSVEIAESYSKELREQGARPRLDYILEKLAVQTTFKRPRVHFSPEDMDWARHTKQDLGGDPLVLCFPQTDYAVRGWPSCYWVDLAWQLKAQNIPSAIFLRDEDQRYLNVPRYFVGCPLKKVAALMSLAGLVVGNDSGPAHLAGTIGTPTLALLGPSRPECVFAHMPEVIPLASDEPPGCAGCHYGHPYRAACDIACQSLHSLWPRVVVATVLSLLGRPMVVGARMNGYDGSICGLNQTLPPSKADERTMQRFSQHGQDIWALRALGEPTNGFFIEMGAHDGVTISNTYMLEQLGWRGICIEPAYGPFAKLCENRRGSICVNALVAGKDRTSATFLDTTIGDSTNGVSGIAELRMHEAEAKPFEMQTRRMIDVLRQYGAPRQIDFFSLDVEGAELEILADFPFEDFEVGLWAIEHNALSFRDRVPVATRICEILVQRGYRYVGDLRDDGLYCRPPLFESATQALAGL